MKTLDIKKNTLTDKENSFDKNSFMKVLSGANEIKKILDFLPVGVVIVDTNKKIHYINNTALELIKEETTENIIGQKCYNIICPSHQENCPILDQGQEINSSKKFILNKYGQKIPILKTVIKIKHKNEIFLLEAFKDITEINQYQEKLKYYATTDSMTGVFNRRTGMQMLEDKLNMIKDCKKNLIIGFIDINNLKKVNDNFGHKEGDKIIVQTTNILKEILRESDFITRIGGDEFLLALFNCTLENVEKIGERLNKKLKQINNQQDKPYSISMSIGFVECRPDNNKKIRDILSEADKKMYENKEKFKSNEKEFLQQQKYIIY